jgi:hypothetical protein
MDKKNGDKVVNYNKYYSEFTQLVNKELLEWIRSMYLVPEEFEFQKQKIYRKVREQILQDSGW